MYIYKIQEHIRLYPLTGANRQAMIRSWGYLLHLIPKVSVLLSKLQGHTSKPAGRYV